MARKKYIVTLDEAEREQLHQMTSRGRTSARKLKRAHILLQADQSPDGGPAWSDERISQTFHVDVSTVEKVRKAFVEHGCEAALERKKPSGTKPRKFDGDKEAHLVTLVCSQAPEGRNRWSLRLLADKLVELQHFENISYETVRSTLKKRFKTVA
jgi:transposase